MIILVHTVKEYVNMIALHLHFPLNFTSSTEANYCTKLRYFRCGCVFFFYWHSKQILPQLSIFLAHTGKSLSQARHSPSSFPFYVTFSDRIRKEMVTRAQEHGNRKNCRERYEDKLKLVKKERSCADKPPTQPPKRKCWKYNKTWNSTVEKGRRTHTVACSNMQYRLRNYAFDVTTKEKRDNFGRINRNVINIFKKLTRRQRGGRLK